MPVAAYSVITGGASTGHIFYSESVLILTKRATRRCAAVRRCADSGGGARTPSVTGPRAHDYEPYLLRRWVYSFDSIVYLTALRAPWVLALAKARQGRSRLKGEPLRNKVDAWCATTTPPGRWHRTATKHPCGK